MATDRSIDDDESVVDWASLRNQREGVVNLAVGHPHPSALPNDALARARASAGSKLASRSPGALPLSYVAREGAPATLGTFAEFLSRRFRDEMRPDALFVTNGVSHGLDLACAALAQPGDVVVLELPTYFLAADIFKDRGLRVEGVPGKASGRRGGGSFDVDAFETRLEQGLRPAFVYLVPTHGNPRGRTMPSRDRARLVELARKFDFFVVADEVYHALDWSANGGPPPRFAQIERDMGTRVEERIGVDAWAPPSDADPTRRPNATQRDEDLEPTASEDLEPYAVAPGEPSERFASEAAVASRASRLAGNTSARCVSVSSFSKILAPGVRVGWIEAAPPLLRAVADRGYVASGGCVAPFAAAVVAEAVANGDQDAFLDALVRRYRANADALADAMRLEGADIGWGDVEAPEGGYFLWAPIPEGVSEAALARCAAEEGVAYLPGARCIPAGAEGRGEGAEGGRFVRLCFAFLDEEGLREGARRLAAAARRALGESGGGGSRADARG